MQPSDDNSSSPSASSEAVRLFPLPNLVMFPHVVQPLHVFEPRYCDLLEDALAGDRKIAMVLLEPGGKRITKVGLLIAPVACVGKVVAHERLPTGRHNILIRGLKRVAIQRELPATRAFGRLKSICWMIFTLPRRPRCRASSQRQLVELARQLLPDSTALHEQLDELLASQASLGHADRRVRVHARLLSRDQAAAPGRMERLSSFLATLRQADGVSRAIDGGRSRPAGNRLSAAV